MRSKAGGIGEPNCVSAMLRSSIRSTTPIAILVMILLAGGASAGTPVDARFQAWRGCLAGAFTLGASLSGAELAADSAFKECREDERAYLSALSATPLVDEEDVARARPALLVRTKQWLLTARANRSL